MKAFPVAAVLVMGLVAQAQSASPTAHAPDGGTRETLQSIAVLPLQGAPFIATLSTEWTKILADGSTATVWNHRTIARDSTGRIFEERRWLLPNGDKAPTQLRALEYSDPNRHEFLSCIVAERTCYSSTYRSSALTAMPPGIGGLQLCGCAGPRVAGVTVTQEALGQQTIFDLETIGSRQITTLPAGQIGNQKPQPIVKEFWYSPRLGLNLVTKRFDPRSGSENFIVNHLSLNEPDAKMFEPPADYQVVRQVVVKQASTRSQQ